MASLYETDPSAWAIETAQLLREQRFSEIDMDALIDEVEDLAGSNKSAIQSYLRRALVHLLKLLAECDLGYDRDERGWRNSVRHSRIEIESRISSNPSLHDHPSKVLEAEFRRARKLALGQLSEYAKALPEMCPWTIEQVLDDDFWPSRENRSA